MDRRGAARRVPSHRRSDREVERLRSETELTPGYQGPKTAVHFSIRILRLFGSRLSARSRLAYKRRELTQSSSEVYDVREETGDVSNNWCLVIDVLGVAKLTAGIFQDITLITFVQKVVTY